MSQLMFIMIGMISAISFTVMKHPMSMGITLMTQTILICMITSTMSLNAWFSYILFLVFLGGMLVLFIYMTSVASNDMFQKGYFTKVFSIMSLIMLLVMLIVDNMVLLNNSEEVLEMSSSLKNMNTVVMMLNYPNNIMTILVVLYLFLTLVVVVKITESHQGPLRSSN